MPPSPDCLRLPSADISEGGPKRNLGTEALSRAEPEVRIHLPPAGESCANLILRSGCKDGGALVRGGAEEAQRRAAAAARTNRARCGAVLQGLEDRRRAGCQALGIARRCEPRSAPLQSGSQRRRPQSSCTHLRLVHRRVRDIGRPCVVEPETLGIPITSGSFARSLARRCRPGWCFLDLWKFA